MPVDVRDRRSRPRAPRRGRDIGARCRAALRSAATGPDRSSRAATGSCASGEPAPARRPAQRGDRGSDARGGRRSAARCVAPRRPDGDHHRRAPRVEHCRRGAPEAGGARHAWRRRLPARARSRGLHRASPLCRRIGQSGRVHLPAARGRDRDAAAVAKRPRRHGAGHRVPCARDSLCRAAAAHERAAVVGGCAGARTLGQLRADRGRDRLVRQPDRRHAAGARPLAAGICAEGAERRGGESPRHAGGRRRARARHSADDDRDDRRRDAS